MVYFDLFYAFLKIGMFSFGGGLAMIPLISTEIIKHQWMTDVEFVKIIGIAEMTPGPIAVNSATFVGFQVAGILGALTATLGVAIPPLLLILILSKYIFKNTDSQFMKMVFFGVKPVIVALITGAAVYISKATVFGERINYETVVIAIIILVMSKMWKLHPIMLIVISAGMGWAWSLVG